MTADEKIKLNQLGKSVTNMAIEIVEIKKLLPKKNEAEIIGVAAGSTISLEDLKATVRVLENYKSQGFKSIKL
jgi:hypothetical protein